MGDERSCLMDRLAQGCNELLRQLPPLDRRNLTEESSLESWTVGDLLAHVAAWDRWECSQIERLVAGEEPKHVAPERFNRAVVEEVRAARIPWLTWRTGGGLVLRDCGRWPRGGHLT